MNPNINPITAAMISSSLSLTSYSFTMLRVSVNPSGIQGRKHVV